MQTTTARPRIRPRIVARSVRPRRRLAHRLCLNGRANLLYLKGSVRMRGRFATKFLLGAEWRNQIILFGPDFGMEKDMIEWTEAHRLPVPKLYTKPKQKRSPRKEKAA